MARNMILQELGDNVVGLVEAFQLSDNCLRSVFSKENGKMWDNMIDWVNEYNILNYDEAFQASYKKQFSRIPSVTVANPKL